MGKIQEKVAALNAAWRAPTLQSADPAPFAWTFTAEEAVEAWVTGAPVLHFAAAVAAREVAWSIWAERFLTARQDLEATLREFWAAANAVRPVVSGLGSANPGATRAGRAHRLPEYDSDLVAVLVLKAKAFRGGDLDGLPKALPEGVATLELSWSSKSALAGLGGSTSNAGGCQGAIVSADWGRAATLLAVVTEAESLLGGAKTASITLPSVTMTDASAYMKALARAWCPSPLAFEAAANTLRQQTMSEKDTRCVSQYSAMEYIAE
jgi:hypothetical protein